MATEPDLETEETLQALVQAGEQLPDDVIDELVEAGPEVTDRLVELALDDSLARLDAPGEGWAPVHAVRVLAKRGDTEVIADLVEHLEDFEFGGQLYEEFNDALAEFGPAAFDPLMEAVDTAEGPEAATGYLDAATRLDVRDDDLFERLVDYLREGDAEFGAQLLARYGDDDAVEPLQHHLDEASIDSSSELFANEAILQIADAIDELGGDLSREHRRKIAFARRRKKKAENKLRRRLKNWDE